MNEATREIVKSEALGNSAEISERTKHISYLATLLYVNEKFDCMTMKVAVSRARSIVELSEG